MTEINMLPYFAESLVAKDFLKEDIEKIYATNRFQFYDFEKKNSEATFFVGRQLPLEREEIYRKLIGIFLYSDYIQSVPENKQESELLNSNIQALFKKGYKKEFNTINIYRRTHITAQIDEIIAMIIHRNSLDKYSAEDTNRMFSAVLFMCIHMFEDFEIDEKTQYLLFELYYYTQQKETISFEYCRLGNTDKEKVNALCKQIPKDLIRSVFFESKVTQYTCFSSLFEVHDMSSLALYNDYPITDKDIKDIMVSYWYTQNNEKEKCTLSIPDFIVAASYIKILLKAYNSAKEHYFSHNQETMFIEIEQKEKQLKILAEDLQSKNSMLQSSKKQLSNVLDEYTTKNAELERKVKKLETELDKAKSHDNELQALRELAFSLSQNTNELTDNREVSEANYEFLNSINALVVGGNLNWQKKMKEKVPGWKYIDGSVRKFNKVLLDCDIIILNTYSMNHSLFYFIMDNINKDVKIHFVNRTNIDECICGIWDKIKK